MNDYEVVNKKIKIDDRKTINIKLINDHFENAKRYQIPHKSRFSRKNRRLRR